MEATHDFLIALGLDDEADERVIRRAYAKKLKQIDQALDPAAFQALRDAYEMALDWAQYRQYEQSEVEPTPRQQVQQEVRQPTNPADALPHTGADAGYPPQAAGQAVVVAEDTPAVASEAERALDTVWTRYRAGVATLTSTHRLADVEAWETLLCARLADEELINIDVRLQFEWRIVQLLGDGWRPGHEALFQAAIEVFDWEDERRALARFGYHGDLLNQAIDELNLFFMQAITLRSVQQRIIMLLRREAQADRIEILHSMRELEAMHVRFPALLFVVTNAENIAYWRAVAGGENQLGSGGNTALLEQRGSGHAAGGSADAQSTSVVVKRLTRWCEFAFIMLVASMLLHLAYNWADTAPGGTGTVLAPATSDSPTLAPGLQRHFAPLGYVPGNVQPGTLSVTYEVFLAHDGSVNAIDMIEPASGDSAFDTAVSHAILDARRFPITTPRVFRTTVSVVIERSSSVTTVRPLGELVMALLEAAPQQLSPELQSHFSPIDYAPRKAQPGSLSVTYEVFLTDDGSVNAIDLIEPGSGDPAFDTAVARAILGARRFPSSTPRVFHTTVSQAMGHRPARKAAMPKPQ